MKFAIIQNFEVKEILQGLTELELQNLAKTSQIIIDVSEMDPLPEIGSKFDGQKIIPLSVVSSKKITRLAMRNRFTMAELVAIYSAAQNNVMFKIYLDSLATASFVDLNRSDTIGGIMFLVQVGIITEARANEILNNPIQEIERYKGDL